MAYCCKCGKEAISEKYCKDCGSEMIYDADMHCQDQCKGQCRPGISGDKLDNLGPMLAIIWLFSIIWATVFIAVGVLLLFDVELHTGALCIASGVLAVLSCVKIYELEDHDNAFLYYLMGSAIGLIATAIIEGTYGIPLMVMAALGIVFAILLKAEGKKFSS